MGLYEKKNTGMWLSEETRSRMDKWCEDRGDYIDANNAEEGTAACKGSIDVISTAGADYCDRDCREAVDEIQKAHDEHEVCPYWGQDHYDALRFADSDFDCDQLKPIQDNSDKYPGRKDVLGKCRGDDKPATSDKADYTTKGDYTTGKPDYTTKDDYTTKRDYTTGKPDYTTKDDYTTK